MERPKPVLSAYGGTARIHFVQIGRGRRCDGEIGDKRVLRGIETLAVAIVESSELRCVLETRNRGERRGPRNRRDRNINRPGLNSLFYDG